MDLVPEKSACDYQNLRISTVIPTCDRGHLIARAIGSILQQTKAAAEIIVIDDGSKDDTRAQVASFGDVVHYIYQDNAGASIARNRGVLEAQSEWVAFLDSDDLWFESHLERMARAICGTSGAAQFYFGDLILPPERGSLRLWEMSGFEVSGEYELAADATDWVMRRWPPMLLQATVFNRQAYLDIGGLWDRLRACHDTHLFLKMGIGGSACAVAGCATRMTADDVPSNRLTRDYDQGQRSGPQQRLLMYQDILARKTDLRRVHTRELKRRMAGMHRLLARIAWKDRHVATAVRHGVQSAAIEPGVTFQRLIDALFGQ
jgi:glycosyltransferase involved in cell wall biosynthesis